ncbi:MAG: restriction endonuclease subunit S [Anaerolineales bacterium]|nr:restriction endonuclease subunit S [Anaerolineales bacterium]
MSSPKIALSEVAQVNPPINPQGFPRDTDVSFVPMSAVSEVTLKIEGEVTRKLNEVNKQYTPFRKGDILIAKITPSFENGKLTIADIRHELGFGTTEFHVVRPTKSILDTRYLFHFLKQDAIRSAGAKRMTGSAGQKRLPASFVAGLQIPLPPLAEQRRIAAILDKVDELHALRRQALARLDDLTQSVFFEMFGDPMQNHKGWGISTLEEIVSNEKHALKRGPFGGSLKKEFFVKSGYKVFEQQHAIAKNFELGSYFIDSEKYKEMHAFRLVPGDFIISCSGTAGKIARVPQGARKGIINQALLKVKLNSQVVNPTFFEFLFEHHSTQTRLFGQTRGSSIKNFPPMEAVRKLEFIVPPMNKQAEFEEFIQKLHVCNMAFSKQQVKITELTASLQNTYLHV